GRHQPSARRQRNPQMGASRGHRSSRWAGAGGLLKTHYHVIPFRHSPAPHAALLGAKFGCTTAPSRVSAVALTISSSHLMAGAFVSLSPRISRNAGRLLAYRLDAEAGMRPATLRWPTILTPLTCATSPGF